MSSSERTPLQAPGMTPWCERIAVLVGQHAIAARAVIVEATAPTPRATGAAMIVAGGTVEGRIGRGELERTVIDAATALCEEFAVHAPAPAWRRRLATFPSGAVLGQPTGGVISVLIEVYTVAEVAALDRLGWRLDGCDRVLARPLAGGEPPIVLDDRAATTAPGKSLAFAAAALACDRTRNVSLVDLQPDKERWLIERLAPEVVPFSVYGTGLIARALVRTLKDLPFVIDWIDTEPSHFPARASAHARRFTHAEPASHAATCRPGSFHAVLTQSHDLDYEICRAVLQRNVFGYLGVIGSALKRQRMVQRLSADGIDPAAIARLNCPIGLSGIHSKQPAAIAVSVAAEALIALQRTALQPTSSQHILRSNQASGSNP